MMAIFVILIALVILLTPVVNISFYCEKLIKVIKKKTKKKEEKRRKEIPRSASNELSDEVSL
jgi:hypothetical protein